MAKQYPGDFSMCREQADGFLETAQWCARDMAFMPEKMKAPFITNIAFACENFMKAILIWESGDDVFPGGHDLKRIFDSLSSNAQKKLKAAFKSKYQDNYYDGRLENFLQKSRNDFCEWRYSFQKREHGLEADVTDYLFFANCLQDYVASLGVK